MNTLKKSINLRTTLPLFVPLVLMSFGGPVQFTSAAVTDIGSRRELFVDSSLVESLVGAAELRLHHPVPQEIALIHDEPWEGTGCGYHSVFQDGDLYRMYYKSWDIKPFDEAHGAEEPPPRLCAYAESDDGIHWRKPSLGLYEFRGSKDNNIVLQQEKVGNVEIDAAHPAMFLDTNPAAPADARYKAIVRSMHHVSPGLLAMKSADGFNWSLMADDPVITDGRFDSQNLAFWDNEAGCYRAYWRIYIEDPTLSGEGRRAIRTGTSTDFLHWENLADLTYEDSPPEQLYTNQVKPYYRAPHLLIGFPNRYLERGHEHDLSETAVQARAELAGAELSALWSDSMKALPELEERLSRAAASERYGAAVTEALLMASRDGVNFKRWNEAFLPPGIEREGTWNYGNQYLAWHVVETKSALPGAPNELSLYAVESYWTKPGSALRRYTLRLDGFVSVRAPMSGGELITKPVRFAGNYLKLNFGTSAAGQVRVEIQDEAGQPLPGFAVSDCAPLYGNTMERAVTWVGGRDVGELEGQAVRLRFEVKDADLYAYRFQP